MLAGCFAGGCSARLKALQLPTVNVAPKSIVLIEDEPSYAELISHLLSRTFDCPVHVFSNPTEAMQGLAALNPAVVITDYHMPQQTGVEFIKAASSKVPDAAFLLMSGQDIDEAGSGHSTLASLKGQLSKPFSWQTLADEIVRVWPNGSPLPSLPGDPVTSAPIDSAAERPRTRSNADGSSSPDPPRATEPSP